MKDKLKNETTKLQNKVSEVLAEIQDSTKLTPKLIIDKAEKLKVLQAKIECIYNLSYDY